ncbi:30S ribosomal protein S4 [Candidatus Woesearchaeota archaeon]|nr:MAG: 30S ribosomal protein S4 [Candidatus Woesearchaeota archaeon]
MGDPKRIRKKYETPRHPWIGSRIQEEKQLKKEFGLANKKEIWKMGTYLKRFKDRAKALIAQQGAQADKEREQLINRMVRLGLIKHGATFDDILGLTINDIMNRRLQTIMVKKNLARSPRQARQMITHRHVVVGDTVVTSPSYLVTVEEEASVGFATRSPFISEQHPERFSEEELLKKRAKEEAKKKKTTEGEEEILAFDEKDIAEAEVLVGEKKATPIVKADDVKDEEEARGKEAAEESKDEESAEESKAEESKGEGPKGGEETTTAPDAQTAKQSQPAQAQQSKTPSTERAQNAEGEQ